jgi:hypothetical protein
MNRFDKQQLGESGVIYESGTTALTGLDICKITTITTTTFSVLTNALATPTSDAITGIAIPAGVDLYGKFTNVTLTSGAVALYKSDKL